MSQQTKPPGHGIREVKRFDSIGVTWPWEECGEQEKGPFSV